jgi:hypothetical protein
LQSCTENSNNTGNYTGLLNITLSNIIRNNSGTISLIDTNYIKGIINMGSSNTIKNLNTINLTAGGTNKYAYGIVYCGSDNIVTNSGAIKLIFHKLIEEFEGITKYPVLVNTSFNVRGEPIVCSATDAFNCFMGTDLDVLVCNNFILYKDNQNKDLLKDYKNKYELD